MRVTELKMQWRCNKPVLCCQNTWQINSFHWVFYEEHTFLKKITVWLQGFPLTKGSKAQVKSHSSITPRHGKEKDQKYSYKKIKELLKLGLAFCRKCALYHFVGKCSGVIQFCRNTLGVETDFCNLWETQSFSLCCSWWGALKSCFPSKTIKAREAECTNAICS